MLGAETLPGLQSPLGGQFWPHGKVIGRLRNGDEDNIAFYYQIIVEQDTKSKAKHAATPGHSGTTS